MNHVLFDATACQEARERQTDDMVGIRDHQPQLCQDDPHHPYARAWGRESTRLCEAHRGIYRFLTQRFAECLGANPEVDIVGLLVTRFLFALPLRALPSDPDATGRLLLVAWRAFRRDWDAAYNAERLALRELQSSLLLDQFEHELAFEAEQHHLNDSTTRFAQHLFLTIVRVVTEQLSDPEPPRAPRRTPVWN